MTPFSSFSSSCVPKQNDTILASRALFASLLEDTDSAKSLLYFDACLFGIVLTIISWIRGCNSVLYALMKAPKVFSIRNASLWRISSPISSVSGLLGSILRQKPWRSRRTSYPGFWKAQNPPKGRFRRVFGQSQCHPFLPVFSSSSFFVAIAPKCTVKTSCRFSALFSGIALSGRFSSFSEVFDTCYHEGPGPILVSFGSKK